MDTQMIIIAVIIVAVFAVPYLLVTFLSNKKKLKLNKSIAALLAESGMSDGERFEAKSWILCLDSQRGKLAVVDKQNLEQKGHVIDIGQLKACNIISDADTGNIILIDLVLIYKNDTPDERFTFYELGLDRHFDVRMLQYRAETLQSKIRHCMAK